MDASHGSPILPIQELSLEANLATALMSSDYQYQEIRFKFVSNSFEIV